MVWCQSCWAQGAGRTCGSGCHARAGRPEWLLLLEMGTQMEATGRQMNVLWRMRLYSRCGRCCDHSGEKAAGVICRTNLWPSLLASPLIFFVRNRRASCKGWSCDPPEHCQHAKCELVAKGPDHGHVIAGLLTANSLTSRMGCKYHSMFLQTIRFQQHWKISNVQQSMIKKTTTLATSTESKQTYKNIFTAFT